MTAPLYRIYDKKNKYYLHWYHFSIDGKSNIRDEYWGLEDKNNYIIERCTGIQDVKGVRMYEGDIVTFGLDYRDIKYSLILEGLQWKISDGCYLKYLIDGKYLEVVGNIHSQKKQLTVHYPIISSKKKDNQIYSNKGISIIQ